MSHFHSSSNHSLIIRRNSQVIQAAEEDGQGGVVLTELKVNLSERLEIKKIIELDFGRGEEREREIAQESIKKRARL